MHPVFFLSSLRYLFFRLVVEVAVYFFDRDVVVSLCFWLSVCVLDALEESLRRVAFFGLGSLAVG
jgi:hypothetical protein